MTNVLFVTADQWRADALGLVARVGSGAGPKTPHIDRLAGEAVRFARHFGGAAPCSPARACLYTGLYQMTNRVVRNGTPLDRRHQTLAEAVRALGFDPTLFGYTDTGTDPRTTSPGDPWLTTFEGILPGMSVRVAVPEYPAAWLSWLASRGHAIGPRWQEIYLPKSGAPALWGTGPKFSAEETQAAFLVGEFERWVSEQRGPWFAHLSFLAPHPPFVTPEPFATLHHPDAVSAPNRVGSAADEAAKHPYLKLAIETQGKARKVYGPPGPETDGSEAEARQVKATYFGMVAEIDHQIGRLRAILEAAGQWDDTLIVLTSDHAEQMGDHHLWGKLGFYDESYRIPLIIRPPGLAPARQGAVVEAFTEAVDVMPTILDLLGAAVPGHLDGHSLRPFLDGDSVPAGWRAAAHFEFDFRELRSGVPQRVLGLGLDACSLVAHRTERFKYVHFAGLPPLLFDLANDPGEQVNVADDPDYRLARIECAEALLAWRARHLDRRLTGLDLGEGGVFDARIRP